MDWFRSYEGPQANTWGHYRINDTKHDTTSVKRPKDFADGSNDFAYPFGASD